MEKQGAKLGETRSQAWGNKELSFEKQEVKLGETRDQAWGNKEPS